ncbi:MAG: hypothetical protein CL693_18970 [Cellvibrionaceae bacterium]|nr:hypothetical protein [Cellvibrionaceae bacterium]|tara:strand:- start:12635 stop:13600 length:966 start_codon:yes stop_codon:yes gene_type:complete
MSKIDKDASQGSHQQQRDLSSQYAQSMNSVKPSSDSDRLILAAANTKAQTIVAAKRHSSIPFFGNEQFAIWKAAAATSIAGVCLWVVLQPSAPLQQLDEMIPASESVADLSSLSEFSDADLEDNSRSDAAELSVEAQESDIALQQMAPIPLQKTGQKSVQKDAQGLTLKSPKTMEDSIVETKSLDQPKAQKRHQQEQERLAKQQRKAESGHRQQKERVMLERADRSRRPMLEEHQVAPENFSKAAQEEMAPMSVSPPSTAATNATNAEMEELTDLIDEKEWLSACELYRDLRERDVDFELDAPRRELIESQCTALPKNNRN